MENVTGWESYKVIFHPQMGCCYAKWNKKATCWQQLTKWYKRFAWLKKLVRKEYGHNI